MGIGEAEKSLRLNYWDNKAPAEGTCDCWNEIISLPQNNHQGRFSLESRGNKGRESGRDKWNANHPLGSQGEPGHERNEAGGTNGVYLPGWGHCKTTWSKHRRGIGKHVVSRLDFTTSFHRAPTSPGPLCARIDQPSSYTSPNCTGIMQFQSYPCVTQGWLPTSKASAPPSLPFRRDKFYRSRGCFII